MIKHSLMRNEEMHSQLRSNENETNSNECEIKRSITSPIHLQIT
jgi:hypothetical protein